MSIRKSIKSLLFQISPHLGERASGLWESVAPAWSGKMKPGQALKYLIRGVCPGLAGRFSYCGTKVYFPKASAIFQRVCSEGTYEQEVVDWICRLIRPGASFIDVGANIGLISIPALRSEKEIRVISFEPSPSTFEYLEHTWRNSGFKDRWVVSRKAVGDCVRTVQFCVSSPRNGAFDGLLDTKRGGGKRMVDVEQTTIDAEWERSGFPSISCLKVDVEGGESKVLAGAEQMIKTEKPYIVLEWCKENLAPYGVPAEFLLDYARSHAYDIFAIPNLGKVVEPHVLELQMLTTESFLLAPKHANEPRGAFATERYEKPLSEAIHATPK